VDKKYPEEWEMLFCGLHRMQGTSAQIGVGHHNCIYKKIARKDLDKSVIEGISSHSRRACAAQNLLNSGASM
jgi:hypothetical protein